ncbi:hypothetical protein SAY87_025475 [Trapa incisa]|uniref:Uncharacterized protein n=1 Tax=Trapa incisa TaxID=236973 RepID=A0AAN7GMF7_9MYRT|nr:hypothetical protein SAY87_025475 [Trapa incisa]
MGTLIPNQDHRFIIKPSPPSQMLPPPSNMIQQSSSPLLLPNFPSQPLSSSLLYRENMCYQPSCYAPAKSPLLFSGLDFSSPTSSVPTVSPLTNVSYPMSNHALDSILQATPGDFQYDYSQMMNKQERTHHHKHLQAFMISEESHHSQTIGVWEPEEKCNDGYYGEGHMSSSSSSAIEYDLEEVKRLIINGSGSNNSVNAISSFLSNPLY